MENHIFINKKLLIGIVTLLRPKQWVKNFFVLAPLLFSGLFFDLEAIYNSLVAFFLFCSTSSATYIMNDIRDVENDRRHPKKSKSRPIASGLVTINEALIVMCLLLVMVVFIGLDYFGVLIVLVVYFIQNIAYSLKLKHIPVLDIFIIAFGFVLRVLAGTVALGIPMSTWIGITTLCLALYLASIKRKQEIANVGVDGRKVLKRYTIGLVNRYAEMSATGALVFYSLFAMTAGNHMELTIPFVLFGLYRYWYVVDTLNGGESPTDALLQDPYLLATIVAWVSFCVWALWP